jgi:hypothetical protein
MKKSPTVEDVVQVFSNDLSTVLELTKDYNEEDWRKHCWYSSVEKAAEGGSDTNCDVLNPGVGSEVDSLLAPLVSDSLLRYLEGSGVEISTFSPPRLNRYSLGQGMDLHCDHISSLFPAGVGTPVLSIVGLLNDDFEGGEFVIRGNPLPLVAGDILVFPSIFLFPHEVLTVTGGTRYSFVSWAW